MNLEIVLNIIRRRWKQSLGIVCIATLATGLILFLQKPEYRGSAIFTAANPNLGDRANIYRTQFWDQYFYYGGEYDNDRLMALARSEEMFRFIADSFQMKKHYKIKAAGERGRYLTDKELKDNITIHKNEYGHVKINVWDIDKVLATQIANAFVKRINELAIANANKIKQEIFTKLQTDFKAQKDSLAAIEIELAANTNDAFLNAHKTAIIQELIEKEKLMQQFYTSINNVAALFIIENAVLPFRKEKPLILNGMITAAIASFFFSVLLIFFVEWRTRRN